MKKINKKGQISIYVFFMFIAIIIIVIAGVLAPMGVLFNTKMLQAGESILNKSMDEIEGINDPTIRTQINDSVYSAIDASADNIEVNAGLFQYSWLLILGLTGLVVFLFSRRVVEISGSGGFI